MLNTVDEPDKILQVLEEILAEQKAIRALLERASVMFDNPAARWAARMKGKTDART